MNSEKSKLLMSDDGMYWDEKSPLAIKSKAFSGRIIRMVQHLHSVGEKGMSPLYSQILRSGTSISANIAESQYAQTQPDFITKLHIALKEANETKNWLNLLCEGNCITQKQCDSMMLDLSEVIAMLIASLKTSKRNLKKPLI